MVLDLKTKAFKVMRLMPYNNLYIENILFEYSSVPFPMDFTPHGITTKGLLL